MAPEAYLDSLQRAADLLIIDEKGFLLDVGCGSGLMLRCLNDKLRAGMAYVGTDFLFAGLTALKGKVRNIDTGARVNFFQADFTGETPLRDNFFDAAIAHFCVYTMGNADKRKKAIINLRAALKQEGTLVIVNPSISYDPGRIIQASLDSLKGKGWTVRWFLSKWLIYPLTLLFGLNYIESQLQKDKWHAYTEEEFCNEIRQGGFDIVQLENVYADSPF